MKLPPHTGLVPLAVFLLLGSTGCGTGTTPIAAPKTSPTLRGNVHGGQQPIAGAQVYLFAAGTAGYGSPSRSMLAAPGFVTTDAAGNFTITGAYTCQPGDLVYLLALGGNAGAGPNSSIALITAPGSCATLQTNAASTFLNIDEVTTVVSIYALVPFISSPQSIGAPTTDATGLANAFALIANTVNLATGTANTTTPIASGTIPQSAINSLANSIASCINSNGSFTTCSTLFAASTFGSSTPAETFTATLNIARHPLNNVATIFALANAQSPFQPSLSSAPPNWSLPVTYPGDVLTYYNNVERTGLQPNETILNPTTVSSGKFGLLRTFSVDGYLYAQPLYVNQFTLPDGTTHNIVFASTSHASVYAFDADGNNPAQGYLWHTQLVAANEQPVATTDYFNCGNPSPEAGIIGTPTIDRNTGTLYVVSKTKLTTGNSTTYYQRLHALNLADGTERFSGPTLITASVPGTGDGSQTVTFDTLHQNERAALLLDNGTVWIAWASHCDIGPYHGWLLGYNASNITQQTAVFNNTPNGSEGGIWMGIGGPSSDSRGNIFFVGGNGTFDANTGGVDVANAAVRVVTPDSPSTTTLVTSDYYAPSNQMFLSDNDLDTGTASLLLFHDPASVVAPNLAVMTDKTGQIYLLNQSNLGHYDTGDNGPENKNGDLQDFALGDPLFNNFAWLPSPSGGTLYVGVDGMALGAYAYTPGNSTTAGSLNMTPTSQTTPTFINSGGVGGTAPVLSANGTANPIIWTLDRSTGHAILYAFDANNLATLLYSSAKAPGGQDAGPPPVKFSSPIIANGKVIVGGINAIAIYGLKP
jgi:hypothetical protein